MLRYAGYMAAKYIGWRGWAYIIDFHICVGWWRGRGYPIPQNIL